MNLPLISEETLRGLVANQKRNPVDYIKDINDEIKAENYELFDAIHLFVEGLEPVLRELAPKKSVPCIQGYIVTMGCIVAKLISVQNEVNELNEVWAEDEPGDVIT